MPPFVDLTSLCCLTRCLSIVDRCRTASAPRDSPDGRWGRPFSSSSTRPSPPAIGDGLGRQRRPARSLKLSRSTAAGLFSVHFRRGRATRQHRVRPEGANRIGTRTAAEAQKATRRGRPPRSLSACPSTPRRSKRFSSSRRKETGEKTALWAAMTRGAQIEPKQNETQGFEDNH